MKFNTNNKLIFIVDFGFQIIHLDSSIKNLRKYGFKHLNPYAYMNGFEKFKEEFQSKEKFYSLLTGKKISNKEYELVVKVWDRWEIKAMEDYHNLHLQCDVLLLAAVFEKFRNSILTWT